jgi:hypothetical protein
MISVTAGYRFFGGWLCAFSILAVISHIYVESVRWQMIPAYSVLLFIGILILRKSVTGKLLTVAGCVLLLGSITR